MNRRSIVLWSVFLLLPVHSLGAARDQTQEKSATGSGQSSSGPATTQKRLISNPADPSLYAGTDTCRTCHDEIAKSYDHSAHWKTMLNHRGVQYQGCEACHGPGKAHAESGGDVTKIIRFQMLSREESSRRCLNCHEFGEEHANFLRSEHLKNNVGCIDCHSAHHSKVERALLTTAQPMLCYGCHQEIRAQFSKPVHHRVNEGLIACTSCHNPHGGFLTRQLRSTAAQDQVCFGCHTDKAGPFVFEHAPVKTEGCVSCHNPHGSSNPRLLKRSQVNVLCLECHTLTIDSSVPGIPSFHNQAQKYQACTLCHVAVHGSNSDRNFFKF